MSRTFVSLSDRRSAMDSVEAELAAPFEEVQDQVESWTSLVTESLKNETFLDFFAGLEVRNCSGSAAIKKAKSDVQKFEEKAESWRVKLQGLVKKGFALALEGVLIGYRLKFASEQQDDSPRASPSKKAPSSKREEKKSSRKSPKARQVETSDEEEDSSLEADNSDSDYEPGNRSRKPSKPVAKPTRRSDRLIDSLNRMEIAGDREFPAAQPSKHNPFVTVRI